jgi:hypothetical protein
MDAIARSHAQLLTRNAGLITRAVDGLTVDELARRPGPDGNPMLWIVAHLAAMRLGLLAMLGVEIERPEWAARFARGKGRPEAQGYPKVDEVLASLAATGPAIRDALARMTETQWAQPSPRRFPVEDESMRGALAFFAFHETYHVGQLAYLRRWLGYPGLVG